MEIKAKNGLQFRHKHYLQTEPFDGKTRQLFQVTQLAKGVVYYRPVYEDGIRGGALMCGIEDFSKYVSQLVEGEA